MAPVEFKEHRKSLTWCYYNRGEYRRAIVIASQLPVAAWFEYKDDATLADAILDRVTANSIRIELEGNSQRQHH